MDVCYPKWMLAGNDAESLVEVAKDFIQRDRRVGGEPIDAGQFSAVLASRTFNTKM